MAKTASKGKGKGNKKRASPSKRVVAPKPASRSLDVGAKAYARLLVDPVGAPLCHPVSDGGEQGYLMRADTTVTFPLDTGKTGGYFFIAPGNLGTGNVEILIQNSVAGVAAGAASVLGTLLPGKTFLGTNAQAARPIAMAVQAMYIGTETNRQGYMYYGSCGGNSLLNGTTYQVAGIGPMLENFERTPSDVIQMNWRPNSSDLDYNSPNLAVTDVATGQALCFAFEGLTPGNGLMFRVTVVWEWLPIATVGLINPSGDKNTSSGTLSSVVNMIEKTGWNWSAHLGNVAFQVTMAELQRRFAGL